MRYLVILPNSKTVTIIANKVSISERGTLTFMDEYLTLVSAFAHGEWAQVSKVSR